jgi:uncharacterized membrane protein YwzB
MGARLGPYNLALVACYAAPTWGAEAIKALTSPYGGLIDPVHAAAAVRLRAILNLPPERLLDVANWLAAFKLVVVAALFAYVIEFGRAVLSDRAPDRATTDTVLGLAVVAVAIWIMQAIVFDPTAVTQAHVAQLLMVAGALIVSTIERHIEDMAAAAQLAGANAAPGLSRQAPARDPTAARGRTSS